MPQSLENFAQLASHHTNVQLAKMFNVTTRTITVWRTRYNIPAPIHSVRPDEATLQKLLLLHNDRAIANMFHVKTRSVSSWREHYKLPPCPIKKYRSRVYTLNERFFSVIDSPEKAYILGLFAADAWVGTDKRTIALALHPQDIHILESIKEHLGSTAPILTRSRRSGFNPNGVMATIWFCSKAMIDDLAQWHIVPNKSLVLRYPTLPEIMERHYIRGLIDGDGNINARNFSLIGTTAVLEGTQQAILRHTHCRLAWSPCGPTQRIVGYRRDRKVLHWLYDTSPLHLHRKYQKYLDHWH